MSTVSWHAFSLNFSWDPPPANILCRAEVYEYYVSCGVGPWHVPATRTSVPATRTSVQITGLRPNKPYQCCISARSSLGGSPQQCQRGRTTEAGTSPRNSTLLG